MTHRIFEGCKKLLIHGGSNRHDYDLSSMMMYSLINRGARIIVFSESQDVVRVFGVKKGDLVMGKRASVCAQGVK